MEEINLDELNRNYDETNYFPTSEINERVYVNESLNDLIDEENIPTKIKPEVKKEKSKKLNLRLLSGFVFLCASVAIIQTGVYIPVFSEVFSPSTPPAVTPPAIVTEINPDYKFSSVLSTEDSISFDLTLENVELEKERCFAYLVKDGNDNDVFLESVSDKAKSEVQIRITDTATTNNFTKYLTLSGAKTLKDDTNYVIVLVKDNKIVKKQSVSTKAMAYISDIKIKENKDPVYKHLLMHVTPNPKFSDYKGLYLELYNETLKTKVPDYSILYKEYISESWGGIPIKIETPVYEYTLRIYCSTDHPENINYTNSFEKDEIKYYLIYTYEEIIKF